MFFGKFPGFFQVLLGGGGGSFAIFPLFGAEI